MSLPPQDSQPLPSWAAPQVDPAAPSEPYFEHYNPQGPAKARTSLTALFITGGASFLAGVAVTIIVLIVLGVVVSKVSDVASSDTFASPSTEAPELYSITVGQGGDLATFEGQVGQCFMGTLDDKATKAESIGASVPCGAEHQFETFVVSTVPLDEFADYDLSTIDSYADNLCLLNFRPYVGSGFGDSKLSYFATIPSQVAWSDGNRSVTCQAFDYDGNMLQKSVRNSRR